MVLPRAWFRPSTVALAISALRATKHITPARLSHWWLALEQAPSLAELQAALARMVNAEGAPAPLKGHPDIHRIKRGFAQSVSDDLTAGGPRQALQSAHRMASMDMRDTAAFKLYIGMLHLANAATFNQLREELGTQVVMHLSCVPRIARAQESCRSFAAVEAQGISQVIVVGSADARCFSYDAATRVLTVPAADTYEQLPAKVVAAMVCFALSGRIEAVLKVDDDHRLKDAGELLRAFRRVRSSAPVQMGRRTNIGVLGQHVRVWHFGKSADPTLNDRPFSLPGTTRWLNGAAGYFLNRQALRLLLWSHIYFPEYIRIGLYEDITLSDLLERQGAQLKITDMKRVLTTVDHY